jgi:beta-glucosidase
MTLRLKGAASQPDRQVKMARPAKRQPTKPARTAATWPGNFIWGVSTSSFQIEGATREDGRGLSIWDTFCAAGRIANRDTGDIACDHYHRYAEDVALMKSLGVQAYRFSVSWPRLLPVGHGSANEAGLAFYDRLIDALLEARIEPWLCLYHWDLPQALDDLGGWTVRDAAGWFADYAMLVACRYGDRVKRFATFNEPSVFTLFGYGFGDSAPGISGPVMLRRAIHHVNLAHGAAVDVIRTRVPDALIGTIHNNQPCLPATHSDAEAAELFGAYWNSAFPDPQCLGTYPPRLAAAMEPYVQAGDLAHICRPLDWFGLNHYSPIYVKEAPEAPLGFTFGHAPADLSHTPIDWPIHPKAFHDALLEVSTRYRLPIYVLENGFGGFDKPDTTGAIADTARIDYLKRYIEAMHQAIADGADVRGYFVWSLLDNFEWGSGYGRRFGLVYVDYPTQKRIPKASFNWYADLIKSARVADGERSTAGFAIKPR